MTPDPQAVKALVERLSIQADTGYGRSTALLREAATALSELSTAREGERVDALRYRWLRFAPILFAFQDALGKLAATAPPSPPAPAMGEWNLDAVMNAVRHYGTTMTNAEILICMGDTLPPLPKKL